MTNPTKANGVDPLDGSDVLLPTEIAPVIGHIPDLAATWMNYFDTNTIPAVAMADQICLL